MSRSPGPMQDRSRKTSACLFLFAQKWCLSFSRWICDFHVDVYSLKQVLDSFQVNLCVLITKRRNSFRINYVGFYCKRFAQSARPGILQLTFFDALEPLWRSCKSAFCYLGGHFCSILGSLLHPGGHFWSTLGILFVFKNRLGRPRRPQGRHPGNPVTLLDTFWDPCLLYFCIFWLKK